MWRNRYQTLSGIETGIKVVFGEQVASKGGEIDTKPFQGLKHSRLDRIDKDAEGEIDTKPFQGLKHRGVDYYKVRGGRRNRYQTLSGIETLTAYPGLVGTYGAKSIPNPFRD